MTNKDMMYNVSRASQQNAGDCRRVGSVWLSAEAETILLDEIRKEHAYSKQAAQLISLAVAAAVGANRTKITPCPPPWTVLRELISCPTCLAYKEGFIRGGQDGFCQDCGNHLSRMGKKKRSQALSTASRPWGGVMQ